MLPSQIYKILENVSFVNSAFNTCGYNAYKLATGSDISLEQFRKIAEEDQDFSLDRILRVADNEKLNIVIISNNVAYVQTNNITNYYGVVRHN